MSSSVSSRDSGPHSDQLEAVVRQLVVYQPPTVLPDWTGWASFDRLGPENNALGG